MKILVTGSAGFIGFYVVNALLQEKHEVVGIDSLNDYYDPELKFARLRELGIEPALITKQTIVKSDKSDFRFIQLNIEDYTALLKLSELEKFDVVVNLAAQAGVRYSIENPRAYIDANVTGFFNVIEVCRHTRVKHLVYASSSSVYGLNRSVPFKESDRVDHPVSLYAATKKANELMAYTYGHLFGLKTTGLRFFTVYGPWGRPDMAYFSFTKAILHDKPIQVFNEGNLKRDFTYIDDIVKGCLAVILEEKERSNISKIYNIGNSAPVLLMDFIRTLEIKLKAKARLEFLPMQAGDVYETYADTSELLKDYGYQPSTNLEDGIEKFAAWYLSYYGKQIK